MRFLVHGLAIAAVAALAGLSACSSNGTTCTVSGDNGFGFDGGSSSSSSSSSPCDDLLSGDGGLQDGSRNNGNGNGGGGGGGGGNFVDSGTIGTDSGGGGGGGGSGIECNPATSDPDFCMCSSVPSSSSNGTACSAGWLRDEGACCADPGWPGSGSCICSSFLCEVNQGGGRDCFFNGASGILGTPTTSATGAACCLRGQGICSCYDANNVGSCTGFQKVSACTFGTVAPCSDTLSQGDTPVSSCR